jgi:hypothetical protein
MPFRDPDKARDYQREYRRTRRAGDSCTTPGTTPLPLPFRLKTAADVLQLLEEQVEAVRAEPEASTREEATAWMRRSGDETAEAPTADLEAALLRRLVDGWTKQWG